MEGCIKAKFSKSLYWTYNIIQLKLKWTIDIVTMYHSKLYSNKKDTSDFHGTVSFDPIKMSEQKIYQTVYQTSDTQKMVII